MPDNYQLTLLRHGESEGNAAGRWQGQSDSPLTDLGRRQAHALGLRWQTEGCRFDRILASPLSRARETAEIVASYLGMPIAFDPVWMERDNGSLAGTARADRTASGPAHVFEPVGEHGESLNDLYLRAGAGLRSVLQEEAGHTLIVAHGGILNQVLSYALGIMPQPQAAGVRFAFGNVGFAQLDFYPARSGWIVRRINDQLHLADFSSGEIWQG